MSFVSYAQNFEDVMLWRALKHVDQGFYVDVGANDPDIDSVTKAFYEQGWRGINIEPIPQWFERLQKERPRDINLQLAAGREPGEITLYEIPDTGLSTAERAFVERHKAERGYQSHEQKVPVETLTNLCERYHTAPIHFLKIDVEGMEKAVLEGLDFQKIRPWIILVESTLPNSQEECHADWEPLLLDAGYQYAYFDGLNRFYVANEHSELLHAFKAPPNVFDDFTLRQQQEAEIRASVAENKAQEAEAKAQEAEARAAETEAREAEARKQAQQALEVTQQAQEQARQAETRAAQAEARAQEAEARAQEAETRAAQTEAVLRTTHERVERLEQELAAMQAKADELNASSHHWWTEADRLSRELHAIYAGESWKLTYPLRKAKQWAIRLYKALMRLPRRLVKAPLQGGTRWAVTFIRRRPKLKAGLLRSLRRVPGLEERLRCLARNAGIGPVYNGSPAPPFTVTHTKTSRSTPTGATTPVEGHEADASGLAAMTPRARRIYHDLKAAIEQQRQGDS
jgi:FkbM family methyltransferase